MSMVSWATAQPVSREMAWAVASEPFTSVKMTGRSCPFTRAVISLISLALASLPSSSSMEASRGTSRNWAK